MNYPVVDKDRARAVAQDVLDRLDRRNYTWSRYMAGSFDPGRFSVEDLDLRDVADQVEQNCGVCLLGSALLSKARLFDDVPLRSLAYMSSGKLQVEAHSGSVYRMLAPIFGHGQLSLLESFFEGAKMPSGYLSIEDAARLEGYLHGAALCGMAARAKTPPGEDAARHAARLALENFLANDCYLVVPEIARIDFLQLNHASNEYVREWLARRAESPA